MGVVKMRIMWLIMSGICVLMANGNDNLNEAQARYKKIRSSSHDNFFKNHLRPYRSTKLNYIWFRASHILSDTKLQSMFVALKLHDKEEMDFKLMAAKDKTEEMELALRNKLIGILSTYDMLDHLVDPEDDDDKLQPHKKTIEEEDRDPYKSLFKDTRLAGLWEKALISGFTREELEELKKEFIYHQEKMESYNNLLNSIRIPHVNKHENAVNEDEHEEYNMISNDPNDNHIDDHRDKLQKYESDMNNLREEHRDIKNSYDRLERLVGSGPDSPDFIEPQVQGLWRVALANNFTDDELDSLKNDLHRFQTRLLKLRNLNVENQIQKEKYKNVKENDKSGRLEEMEQQIKKQQRKVEKLQEGLEQTIFKHTEL